MDILSRILAEDTIKVIMDYFGYKELLIRFWLRGKLVVDYNIRVLGCNPKKKTNYLNYY